ncbi:mechanosensitive ion channel family protein [Sutcliffiella horikoshii]|uniref:mechanosensitive ion channel family protein n=1 Tax=Sutcliffiella horikoshii TaxID=79883 RepID=UPI00203DDFC7|nr:mechanosensitive ion channel family protein [Sutcliffiella horikoshii]
MNKTIDWFSNLITAEYWTDINFWLDVGVSLLILLLFLLWRKLFTKYFFKGILAVSRKTPTDLFTYIVLAFDKPVRVFFVILGIFFALKTAPFTLMEPATLSKLMRSSIIGLISWGIFNFVPYSSNLFTNLTHRLEFEVDKIVMPFVTKVVRFILLALTFSIVLDVWGYDVGGIVAGLGLGGLAFALAAQESLKNLLGGFIIVTEKPFTMGDWIKTPSVEGVVEDISFRSTQVRTFAQAVVTVPNATLSNEPITNWSKMGKRQITFNLGVQYDTTRTSLERVVRRIENMLRNHKDIDQETILVRFDSFNASSLDIFTYFFTKSVMWGEYLEVKEDINFKIMEILEEENVAVAFPTRTLHFEKNSQEEKVVKEYSMRGEKA